MAKRKERNQNEQISNILTAAEQESEFMLRVEEGAVQVDANQLKNLHRDELLEIREFVDDEKEPQLYAAVSEALRLHTQPRIEIARIDERVWSYFYDKYILRIILALWLAVAFFLLPAWLPKAENPELNHKIVLAAGGAVVITLFWRIIMAAMEARDPGSNLGNSPVRRRLGIRVIQADGRPPGFWRSLGRGILKTFPFYFITLISMELSRSNRGLHDRLFGTYVVRINAKNVTPAELAEFVRSSYGKQ